MSQQFHGTIFSFPSTFSPDSKKEERKARLRLERDELSEKLSKEGFHFKGNDYIPYVSPNDPIYRAIEKAMGD